MRNFAAGKSNMSNKLTIWNGRKGHLCTHSLISDNIYLSLREAITLSAHFIGESTILLPLGEGWGEGVAE